MSDMSQTAGVPGGIPDLAKDEVKIIPTGTGAFYLCIGRRDKTRHLWISAEAVANLPAAVAEVMGTEAKPARRTRSKAAEQ